MQIADLGEATNFYRGTSGLAAERSGSYGYAINNIAYGYARSNQFDVTAGTQYDVHAWVRGEIDAESSHGTAWIVKVRWYDSRWSRLLRRRFNRVRRQGFLVVAAEGRHGDGTRWCCEGCC